MCEISVPLRIKFSKVSSKPVSPMSIAPRNRPLVKITCNRGGGQSAQDWWAVVLVVMHCQLHTNTAASILEQNKQSQSKTSSGTVTCLDVFHSWRGANQNLDVRTPVLDIDRLVMASGRSHDTVLYATGVKTIFEHVAAYEILDGRAQTLTIEAP